jgi:hypothetical protein
MRQKFIRGPIPFAWVQAANTLPGKAGAIAWALWFLAGVKGTRTFALTREAQALAACSRQALSRGLAAMAAVGLIAVQPRPGARTVVTILDL